LFDLSTAAFAGPVSVA